MTREFFIAIDPITTVHMGICNAPQTLARAHALAAALRARHGDFLQGEENLKEHAATHYMEPQARLFAEQRILSDELASSDKKILEKWQHTVRGASLHSAALAAAGLPAEYKADEVHNIEDVDDVARDQVISKTKMDRKSDRSRPLPALENIFIGENRLLLTHGSMMSVAECELVYNILLKQGCRSTAHVVRLLKWSSGCENSQKLSLFISFGIPAYHAVEAIEYFETLL